MMILMGTVFVASVLGSLHCVGMCGPFALMASGPVGVSSIGRNKRTSPPLLPTLSYSLGRLTTYTLVGVLFGLLGMALNHGASFAHWQQAATYVAGGLMIAVGLIALARQLGWRVNLPGIGGRVQQLLQPYFQTITRQPPLRRAFLIGAFSCLMPCGWLYTFAIVAAGTGSPLAGALIMVTFWAGTVPVMTALTLGLHRLSASFQRHVPVAMASMVVMIGIFTIAFRAPVAIGQDVKVTDQNNLIQQVQSVDQTTLPCCHKK